jgi:diguanylate cyclase (GGDEF)-like protein
VPRLPGWGAAAAVLALVVLAGWIARSRGKDAVAAAALWPPLHALLIATGSLASPLAPLALGWLGLFARRAEPRRIAPAAGVVALLGLLADSVDGSPPAWTTALGWIVTMAVGALLMPLLRGGEGRGRTRVSPAEPMDAAHPRRGGEATDAEAVETALATVMRATDAHEAALWRAEGEDDGGRTAVLLSRVAAPDVAAPESPVALAGHPFAWAVDERLPQRIERGKKPLPSPWASEMLLVPVETAEGVRVLALGYPGMVPPGAETAAVRAGHHLATLLTLLRARDAVHRAEAGLRAMGEAMRTLPGALELNEFAAQLAAAVRAGTGAAGAAVAMADEGGRGKVLHVSGESIPMDAEAFGEGDSRLALAVKHGVELSHADLRRERDRLPLLTPSERWEAAPRSAVVLPLMLDGRAIGAVAAWHPEPARFAEREMEIVRLLVSVAPLPMRSARRFEALDQRASTDPLTGLANRSTFDARLAAASSYYERYARPFSLVALDVDFFKKFNDTWGHEAGDRVLQHVAELLRATVRDVDLPARLGGEEFVVLLPETGVKQAMEAAERIRRTLEARAVIWNGHPLRVTASLGVSACPDCTTSPAEVLSQADAALYRAKDAGRNQVASAWVVEP